MPIVNDAGNTAENPCGMPPASDCSAENYAAWRRLAVDVRRAMLQAFDRIPEARRADAAAWLRDWGTPTGSAIDKATGISRLGSQPDPEPKGFEPRYPVDLSLGDLSVGTLSVGYEAVTRGVVGYMRRGLELLSRWGIAWPESVQDAEQRDPSGLEGVAAGAKRWFGWGLLAAAGGGAAWYYFSGRRRRQ